MSRRAVFTYAVVVYGLFLATFVWAIAFIGGFLVPNTLDGAPRQPAAVALAVDAALLSLFAVQHSVMARRGFKQRWTRVVPAPAERATYVLASSLALILLFLLWQPLGGVIWSVQAPAARIALWSLFGAGWALVLVATFLIDHFELFGLSQAWRHLHGSSAAPACFTTPGPYRLVRHPLYVGWLLVFWMTPQMTAGHLLFAVATTAYILVAIRLEERDLVHEHGRSYEEYRRRVPMLLPLPRRRAPAEPITSAARRA